MKKSNNHTIQKNNQSLKNIIANILLNYTSWILIFIVSIVAATLIPHFAGVNNFLNIIVHMIPNGMTIFAMGLCLMTGFFDLSLESTYAIAPIIGALVITRWFPDFPGITYIGIAIVMMTGLVVGLVNGILSIKLRINPFLVTLCTNLILRGLSLFLIPNGIYNLPRAYTFLGSYRMLNNKISISFLFFLIVIIVLHWMITKKPFGRHILAIGSNERAAYLAGIKTERVKITVFAIAGLLAALGGLIAAGRQNAVLNSMGSGNMILMFAGAVLGGLSLSGGVGSIFGILGGILLLQIISNLVTLAKINPFLIQVVYGSVLLFALLLQALRSKLTKYLE